MRIEDITPERVKLAYERTGLRPIRGSWAYRDIKGQCWACALTAVAIDEGVITFDGAVEDVDQNGSIWGSIPGVIGGEAVDFVRGFDNASDHPWNESVFRERPYLRRGLECRKAIQPYLYSDVVAAEVLD